EAAEPVTVGVLVVGGDAQVVVFGVEAGRGRQLMPIVDAVRTVALDLERSGELRDGTGDAYH
ncbi:hypothetical protein AB0958_43405, partial [Streptomyces sp. NPDC006655]|uniref:hypothetical protein n=1 Tax=Streptomyces sp. NPDC006655 TaxID=3156898 RepID=UPI003453E01E